MAFADQIIHNTVRIETSNDSGLNACGTGFFYRFDAPGERYVQVIVTNRHVVRNMSIGELRLTLADAQGKPQFGKHEVFRFEQLQNWCEYHPDPEVDLAIIYIAVIINTVNAQGKSVHFITLNQSHFPSPDLIDSLTAFEEVIMAGYPNGLWDSANNLPIVRRGYTATPYARDFKGKSEFMIDAACFPGSSGSPIYLANEGSYSTKDGSIVIGSRFALLGILYAGPTITATGELDVEPIPTDTKTVKTALMIHLGQCVRAERLRDFEKIIAKKVSVQEKLS
jgi:V8-like Glu-specific endopeptidase